MSGTNGTNGTQKLLAPGWGYAVEGQPPVMLRLALASLRREGAALQSLPACHGEACAWVRQIAECLHDGSCKGAALFCDDSGLACCITNKVGGVRAVPVWTVSQAERALFGLGANLLIVEMRGRTYFEYRQILRLGVLVDSPCPPGVACVLQELDGHAHR